MGGEARARRQERAREFGRRHPRLVPAILCVLLAGVVLICVAQLAYGTYLGRGWVVAALAGIAAAVGLGLAALLSNRRLGTRGRSPVAARLAWAGLVAGLVSVAAFRIPFPRGSYGGVQAVFNVVHAALLGYELVFTIAILAIVAYQAVRPGRRRPRV